MNHQGAALTSRKEGYIQYDKNDTVVYDSNDGRLGREVAIALGLLESTPRSVPDSSSSLQRTDHFDATNASSSNHYSPANDPGQSFTGIDRPSYVIWCYDSMTVLISLLQYVLRG